MKADRKKTGIGKLIVEQINGLFLPIINVITGASILKSIVMLLASSGVLSAEGGVYRILYAATDGFFYFLPFYLAITAAKQWKTDPYISLLIPIAMLYPDMTAVIENGSGFSLLGFSVPPTIYHSSVIPVLLAVGLLHFVEKPCDKYIHETVRGFLKPIICCLVVLPVTFLLFGPIGSWMGDSLTKLFFVLYDRNSVAAGIFMGFIIQPMVAVGAHWSVVPFSISNIMNNGYDLILPLLGAAVYAQGGAALAVALLYKKNTQKRRVAYQASLSAVLGVSEPALFAVNVPLVRPMLAACTAGAIGGGIVGIAGTHCYSFAFPSFLTSVAYIGPGFAWFLFSMVLGFILGFLFTYLQKKQIARMIANE